MDDTEDFDFSQVKVLCIDDSKINVTIMASLLQSAGMSVEVAFNAKEGLEKADADSFNLILLDHMMPEMDGIEAFKLLRAQSKKNANTPTIILTGNADESYTELYEDVGFDGYLIKPVLKDRLLRTIISVVDKKNTLI